MNPKLPFNSINLLRLLISLGSDDQTKLSEAMTPAIWEEGLDVRDATTALMVLTKAGFDAESLAAKAQEPAIKQAVIDSTKKAFERGVLGIPTFFIGEQVFFGKELLGQIEEMLENS